MVTPLSLLILEDSADDALLLVKALQQSGFDPQWQQVETQQDYLAALPKGFDIILADYTLPQFDALQALQILQQSSLDIPLIVVTGSISEEVAVQCMKQGAADYLLKDRLARLGPAVAHALQDRKLLDQKRQAEVALQQNEAKFRSLIQHSTDLITILELDGTIKYTSPAHKTVLGYQSEDLLGKSVFELIHPDDLTQAVAHLQEIVQTAESHLSRTEFRVLRQDGSWCVLESTGSNLLADSSVGGIVINSRDVTQRKQAEDLLIHNAFHDQLTQLPNRALFLDRLEQAIYLQQRRDDFSFAVFFLDLDRFKVVNDSLGHQAGDQLLSAIAQRLKVQLRLGDTFARLGGDEFAILLENIRHFSDVTRVADRIQQSLAFPFDLNGHEVFTNVSIGITLSTPDHKLPEDFLREADIAMYRAKTLGKDRYEIFSLGMHEQALAHLQLETDLQRAVDSLERFKNQPFELQYQPIVSLETSSLIGFEALLRWQHPQRGLVCPADFIPLAEETGLIVPLGQWVLRQACRQTAQWQRQFPRDIPLSISVNISGRQFAQPDLLDQIKQILVETGLNACSLKLEITESILIENTQLASTLFLELKALGIQLYMDDFGTGYSSLSYLHHFPVDMLKIDRCFVNSLDNPSQTGIEHKSILQTIVMLAQNLGIDVTAEGVETAAQLAQLKAIKCDYGQGYFFSQPIAAVKAAQFIAADRQASKPLLTA